jgi:hypothetical protein
MPHPVSTLAGHCASARQHKRTQTSGLIVATGSGDHRRLDVGGPMLKMRFIGRGMHPEFYHPAYSTQIVTSPILKNREPVESVRGSPH